MDCADLRSQVTGKRGFYRASAVDDILAARRTGFSPKFAGHENEGFIKILYKSVDGAAMVLILSRCKTMRPKLAQISPLSLRHKAADRLYASVPIR
ncbi:MAG: hypothetical protein KDJ38_09715 [Gammaproteobacteria bacterium]|nr:hypothetical protein [Gammaproteobacteria bacterium]